jgi:hypothetical protein
MDKHYPIKHPKGGAGEEKKITTKCTARLHCLPQGRIEYP